MTSFDRFLLSVLFGCAAAIVVLLTVVFFAAPTRAQSPDHNHNHSHSHPVQDEPLHEKFYSTWQIPNQGNPRALSCCNKHDCYPAPIRHVAGVWFFRRREDGAWLVIPDAIIEQNQSDPKESPDGRAHVCSPPPHHAQAGRVFCATLGGGI